MTSRQRVQTTLSHQTPDRIPLDFGATTVSGMHVSCVAALRDFFGLERRPVPVIEPAQMLGWIEEDLKQVLGIDTEGVLPRKTGFGFPLSGWKPYRMDDGLEVLVPGGFNVTIDGNGDTLMHPQGDLSAPPSARMPKGGYFFDAIIRQPPLREEDLDPADNVAEYGRFTDEDVAHFARAASRAAATGRAVVAKFGSGFGDVATIPGIGLKEPRGIRDIAEWYMSIRTRPDYIHALFSLQAEIVLHNLERVRSAVHDSIDCVQVCGTDFGTQKSTFCSTATFRELWMPYYRRVNDWIHSNTRWKTFKHSCGSVVKFIDLFIESGFDVLNPVQVSAAGMDPETLKTQFGDRIVFWGGGVDTQQTLSFGTPQQVRDEVLRHCRVFHRNGGFVFNAVHNVQARTPVGNIVAMINAVREFHGEPALC